MRSKKGMRVVAAAGAVPQPEKLPTAHDEVKIVQQSEMLRIYSCGHRGSKEYALDIYGQVSQRITDTSDCPMCRVARIKKHTIRCAACGLPIFPGEGVALYAFDGELFDRNKCTFVKESVLGCMRWDCCPSGAFFAGNWSEQGFVPRFAGNNTMGEQCVQDNE
ncbi:MAG: hypothetical protein WC786_02405 [Patescibacteria group bacterium]